ncbi:putative metal-dependent enzyme (double-stranded beta helix superfamily) [Humitalea rosea]|uniref:Putative metal-dependent enzyme (Double-stranded beta helix superfamily) n=1 Tax=Humitalea rosea TaxID=990373 RepID=A0A2W7IZ69_9PROT|nr:cysteine dioxygenase family protein [Humitalea rosea]PZW44727.1 putative metal-dependent enzyme (double-stranded beta helix superfamily) [Humitalea rosea]
MNADILAGRVLAVDESLARIHAIVEASGINRPSLTAIREELLALAEQRALFPAAEFLAAEGQGNRLHSLREDLGGGFALYLNVLAPGQDTRPHDHGTWFAAAALEGQALHRVYSRTDDGVIAGRAVLRLREEIMVEPGRGIALMPDDIHSLHTRGDRPGRHLHLYGMALERLTDRHSFDLATSTISPYAAEDPGS